MPDLHKNFAYSTVATAPSTPTAGTSLVVAAGQGALFPTPPFNATVWPVSAQPTSSTAEIVRVTGISTDTLTIVRTQEGGGNRSILVGDQISANITKKTFDDIEAYLNPTGTINAYGGRAAPSNWLLCSGANISRTTYADLFNVLVPSLGTMTITIAAPGVVSLTAHGFQTGDQVYFTTTGALPTGITANTIYYVIYVNANSFQLATTRANSLVPTPITTTGSQSGTHTTYACPYGLGDGSTTFTLPDLRGRVPAGNDSMGGTGASRLILAAVGGSAGNLGASGGEQSHVLTVAELAGHTHSAGNVNGGGYGIPAAGNTIRVQLDGGFYGNNQPSTTTGSDAAHNVVQPTLVTNYIIKT